jgi:hypothetical protein
VDEGAEGGAAQRKEGVLKARNAKHFSNQENVCAAPSLILLKVRGLKGYFKRRRRSDK